MCAKFEIDAYKFDKAMDMYLKNHQNWLYLLSKRGGCMVSAEKVNNYSYR